MKNKLTIKMLSTIDDQEFKDYVDYCSSEQSLVKNCKRCGTFTYYDYCDACESILGGEQIEHELKDLYEQSN